MKLFIALCATLAYVSAEAVLPYAKVEGDGEEYHFGYNDGQSARQEVRTADGVVRGAYSFVDANGVIQTVSYTADPYNGYVVLDKDGKSSVGVAETPEVKAAREAHLAYVNNAGIATQHTEKVLVQPQVIQYQPVVMQPALYAPLSATGQVLETPEVQAANAAHFEAVRRAQYVQQSDFVAQPQVVSQGNVQYVAETPDVFAATLAHYEALRKAGLSLEIPAYLQPTRQQEAVQYTPEVAAARAAHFEAVRKAMAQF
ncbi:hypothetical protein ACFFRR_011198 [Megaselia abdita]